MLRLSSFCPNIPVLSAPSVTPRTVPLHESKLHSRKAPFAVSEDVCTVAGKVRFSYHR